MVTTKTHFDSKEVNRLSSVNGIPISLSHLRVKLFADGAEKKGMLDMLQNPLIAGFTTNPTLMRKAGVIEYEEFARDVLKSITNKPISFEVFSDDLGEMGRQAMYMSTWAPNVFVKIPITNTKGESSLGLVATLAAAGVSVNVTAIMTLEQVMGAASALNRAEKGCISVFAGRIADSGRDPVPIMKKAVEILKPHPHLELIWASPREVLNVMQADEVGCHIITMTNDIIKKLPLIGKDLDVYSLDTVRMFYNDAQNAGYALRHIDL